ncbi:hypothetical protein SAMN04487948_104106 [Halogranum amylolyticum]|uniref:Uncharacterized protein n=1 Tax=Halogranum amylolyticum TaxID=660520 RepID=A0A1H8RMG2_9EURY|nr:hypothetical protein SAMN04487948_104106 [Halogranum amylolyticum]
MVAIDLLEPADYRLEIGSDGEKATAVVGSELFDRSDSATDVAVRADRAVTDRTVSTTMGCSLLS